MYTNYSNLRNDMFYIKLFLYLKIWDWLEWLQIIKNEIFCFERNFRCMRIMHVLLFNLNDSISWSDYIIIFKYNLDRNFGKGYFKWTIWDYWNKLCNNWDDRNAFDSEAWFFDHLRNKRRINVWKNNSTFDQFWNISY